MGVRASSFYAAYMDHPAPDPAADSTERVLRLIEGDAEGCLRLQASPGQRTVLPGLRLDGASLRGRAAAADTVPAWWRGQAAYLRRAELSGAELPDADLSGADLSGAALEDVALRSARMTGARLEAAQLARADLSGADLSDVRASEADFSDGLLEDVRLPGANLRFARFTGALLENADLAGADLWGARLDGAEAMEASFRGALLNEASLAKADLASASFEGAELKKSNLQGAKLRGADLRGASLAGADLTGADLRGASLPRVDLSRCTLHGVRLSGAWLESTRFDIAQLGPGLGEELAGEFAEARRGYLTLEQNFRGIGDPEAATWCYLRARRMGKRAAFRHLRTCLHGRAWRDAPLVFARWAGDAFAEWLCDYGESLPRVLRAFVTVLLCFAALYGLSGALVHTAEGRPGLVGQVVGNPLELLEFSFLNMCMSGIPDIGMKPANHFVYFVSSMQYVLGLVLLGLFGYVLGNRIRR